MQKITSLCLVVFTASLPIFAMTACKSGEKERCSYQIDAEYFAEGRLDATVHVKVVNNTQNTLDKIPFVLYGNAFAEGAEIKPVSDLFAPACYYGGESYGGMEIAGVEGATSFAVTEDGSTLTAYLAEPLYPDESVTLCVDYTLTLAKANHRLGVGENCVNLAYFYPMLPAQNESGFYGYTPSPYGEPFVLDCADISLRLRLPAGMGAASGGDFTQETLNDGAIYCYEGESVRDAALALGSFSTLSKQCGGVQVDYYYFADADPSATLQIACDALTTYQELFGAYAYSRFAFAETDLYLGGMEYSGFVALSALLRKEERAEMVAHEVAHQWWYALVSSNQAECAWQDEGLAQYCVALFFENNPGYNRSYRDLIASSEGAYRSYFSVKSQLLPEVDTSMNRPLNSFSGDYEYRILAYDKGVVLFDRLRSTMGDRRFFSALKGYAQKYRGEVATAYDLTGCFSSQEELILSFTEGRCVI